MSRQAIKTNNDADYVKYKVTLRLMSLPKKKEISVLEAFGGEGVLWNEVKKLTDKKIKILSIDKNNYNKVNLQGDNIKFLKGLDLSKYDIIDLDSWGSPINQLRILKEKKYKGIVHCTFIQTMFGKINNEVLYKLGYTKNMVKKCPSLFNKNGFEKMKQYISTEFDVSKITVFSHNNKNYFYITI